MLQRQHQESKKRWSDHWDYLELHAEELADDFGLWLAQGENGQADSFCQPIPVKAVARFLNEQGEEAFGYDLSAGRVDESLNFALEVRVSGDDSTRPPSVLRLSLAMEALDEDVKLTVIDSGRPYPYSRSKVPHNLFEGLLRLCEEALNV